MNTLLPEAAQFDLHEDQDAKSWLLIHLSLRTISASAPTAACVHNTKW